MDEVEELKKKLNIMQKRYNNIVRQLSKQDRIYKRLEEKYKTAILEYSNFIQKQIDIGVELEARIKELEGDGNKKLL